MIQVVLFAQPVKVGLFQDQLVAKAVVYCSNGSFTLITDGVERRMLEANEILYLTLEEGKVRVLDSDRDFGQVEQVELRAGTSDAVFRLRPISPELESRVYDDDLLVTAGDRFLTLVNRVDLDKYIAGVVQAEAGGNSHIEFYKAQAILCRTYAMKQNQRHATEGFSLCDGTHCQVYKGRSTLNPEILEAVLETTGIVVTDFNYKLITAAYHSNSGDKPSRLPMFGFPMPTTSFRWWIHTPCISPNPSGGIPYPLRSGSPTCSGTGWNQLNDYRRRLYMWSR